ncbi:MAG: hypothetical protein LC632_03180 [Xanthomonadaceae bacterium]|nr:hypothetical protein [Xanthomonadaceae bacterium]
MKELAIRIGLLAFAATAALLIWLPSDAPPHPTLGSFSTGSILLGGYYFWTVFIVDATSVLALGLVALMMIRPDIHRGAIPLAIGLCSAVTAWGVGSANEIPGVNFLVTLTVVMAGFSFTAAGLIRFLSLFPHALSTEEIADGLSSLRWGWRDVRSSAPVSDPIAARWGIMQALGRRLNRVVWLPLFGKSLYRRHERLTRKFALWVGRFESIGAAGHYRAYARRIQKPWPIACMLTLLLVIAVIVTPSEIDHISTLYGIATVLAVTFGLLAPMPVIALIVARIGYLRADAEMKHRSLWVMEAFLIAMSIFVVVMTIDYASHILWDTRFLGLTALGAASACLAFVVCLILALFSGGAFDPRLIIRGTAFIGLFSVILAFMFAVVEEFLTSQISARFDLPESTGLVVSAAIAAAVFGPLWRSINRWVTRQLGATAPREVLARPLPSEGSTLSS